MVLVGVSGCECQWWCVNANVSGCVSASVGARYVAHASTCGGVNASGGAMNGISDNARGGSCANSGASASVLHM